MKYFFCILIAVLNFSVKAQNDSLQFPQDFYGIYKGDLQINNANGKQIIGMEFHLNKTDSIGKYEYMLVYVFDGKRQERKYNLIEKNSAKGEYIVDENNGILLDAKLLDNTLYFMFEVQNNIITTTERFYKDSMDFEITFSNTKQKTSSGTEGKDAIPVISYPIGGIQKAHLIKQVY
ncbi:hypothetical protein Q4512_01220 [Oceanihabitans sp. 2_MG-2023]|uniref:hypothetical protein n=1 Tax=Oceanihabitans sp. 2_MG-2023 TaxID=3062661 RepID=UPI0026E3FC5A|nr:hypothetical protein [Oceanihabitans sp. 2_MG-2023]MDO6595511.1 hypothetical protein [Oceanihabitans sp. 2_MG-2023]